MVNVSRSAVVLWYVATYADDGNVLDVVVGRHAVGSVLGEVIHCCELIWMSLLCNKMVAISRKEAQWGYLCIVAGTMESGLQRCLTPTSYHDTRRRTLVDLKVLVCYMRSRQVIEDSSGSNISNVRADDMGVERREDSQ